ncbi:MAG: ABC transporter permease subunit [Phycisphaeraceae bacterium]|nr:MAG: ABC transporter permease subunit [Phycisphaeraceae bacterium]
MRSIAAIAGRELGAMFRTPVGWIVTALYTLLTAVVFTMQEVRPGEPATLRSFFAPSAWLLIVVAPAVSMRLFSEEFRSGTVEPLLTAPVSRLGVMLGKYAGAAAFIVCMLIPTLAYPALLAWAADGPIDWGAVASGYVGLVLVALVYLAVGTLVSTTTDSQVLAFLVTLIVLLLVMIASGPGALRAPVRLAPILAEFSVPRRAANFARGVVETKDAVALLAASGWMLALAWVSLMLREGR